MLDLYGSDLGMHSFAVDILLLSRCLLWSLPLQAMERPVTLAIASGSNNMHVILAVATVASASVVVKQICTNTTVTPWRNSHMRMHSAYFIHIGLPDQVKIDSDGELTSPRQLVGIVQQPCQILAAQHRSCPTFRNCRSSRQRCPHGLCVVHTVKAILASIQLHPLCAWIDIDESCMTPNACVQLDAPVQLVFKVCCERQRDPPRGGASGVGGVTCAGALAGEGHLQRKAPQTPMIIHNIA